MGFTDEDRVKARAIIDRYPHAKSAMLPLLLLAQDRDGWVTPEAMEEIAVWLGTTPALVLGTCSFYTMLKREPVGDLVVSVCTNIACLVNRGPELLDGLRSRYEDDTAIMVEEVECIAACDRAPAIQINYEYYGPVDTTAAVDVIEQYRRGELQARTISGSSRGAK